MKPKINFVLVKKQFMNKIYFMIYIGFLYGDPMPTIFYIGFVT
jgi:hypothetical protein